MASSFYSSKNENIDVSELTHFYNSGLMESAWTKYFGLEFSLKGKRSSLYTLHIDKRAKDLQRRIVHGARATNR